MGKRRRASSSLQGFNHLALLNTLSTRYHSPSKGSSSSYSDVNGSTSTLAGEASDIIESAAASTQWKRNHHRKIEDKFNTNDESNNSSSTQNLDPRNIDNYEDVQPMWKEMESRVTRRRSLTLEQRGGISGRRNVRKSEEDYWEKAGVYNNDIAQDKTDKKAT